MKFEVTKGLSLAAAAAIAALVSSAAVAQAPPAAGPPAEGAGRAPAGPPKTWWVEKRDVNGPYKGPMRPLWKVSDLKAMHPGQHTWSTQIIKDLYQDVTYESAAPGTKRSTVMHPNTPEEIVVTAGQLIFHIEGQEVFTAKRGEIVFIPAQVAYSYEATGTEDALFVDINVLDYQNLYPSTDPAPKAKTPGGKIIQIGYNNPAAKYENGNQPHWNLWDALAACKPMGRVNADHIQTSPLLGYVNPADNKCPTGRGNVGNTPLPGAGPAPKIDTNGVFGHLHKGPAEWWIVQAGQITGNFEKQGVFVANEGDVLYAQPDMWHQMAATGASGPSVRTATYGALGPNLNNTAGGAQ
jgi:quercetin dioxygenase-like cupin family protein